MPSVGPAASPPPVTPPAVQYAGFGIRLAAYMIDLLILVVADAIAIFAVILLTRATIQQPEFARDTGLSVSKYACALIGLVYFVYFWGRQGATPGKKMLKLCVRLRAYPTASFGIGEGKAFVRLIGYGISSFLLFLPFLMILFNQERRGLHDVLAGTIVVREG
jgi:uncharacterized RDD family membrane protein YckC